MNRSILLAGSALLSLLCSFTVVDTAYALAGSDPNVSNTSTLRNFRRSIDVGERYRRNKRSLKRRDIDQFTTATGSTSTFHRREDYLREAYQKRFQADLDSKPYSGINRPNPLKSLSENRTHDSILRRIRRAERGGNIFRTPSQPVNNNTAQDRLDRAAALRTRAVDKQIRLYSEPTAPDDCSKIIGRRRANCYYEQQNQ